MEIIRAVSLSGSVAVNPRLTKLIISLRTATKIEKGGLDKKSTSQDDVLDALGCRCSIRLATNHTIHVLLKKLTFHQYKLLQVLPKMDFEHLLQHKVL